MDQQALRTTLVPTTLIKSTPVSEDVPSPGLTSPEDPSPSYRPPSPCSPSPTGSKDKDFHITFTATALTFLYFCSVVANHKPNPNRECEEEAAMPKFMEVAQLQTPRVRSKKEKLLLIPRIQCNTETTGQSTSRKWSLKQSPQEGSGLERGQEIGNDSPSTPPVFKVRTVESLAIFPQE